MPIAHLSAMLLRVFFTAFRSRAPRPGSCSMARFTEEALCMDNICLTTKRLVFNQNGQALVEYTLVVLLVTFVFWLGIRDTDFGQGLQTAWTRVSGSISPTT